MPDPAAMMQGGGAPPGGAPPGPGAAPGGAPPVGAPMTTPQPNQGAQQAAQIDISMAMDLLEKSLLPFGSESEQGKAILGALQGLSKSFGAQRPKSQSLVPAELRQLMQGLPQGGGGSPELKALMGGGGAPGGAPGGQPPMPAA